MNALMSFTGGVVVGEGRTRREPTAANAKMQLSAVLLLCILRGTQCASFGGWTCTNTILNQVISQGTFTEHSYAPFVSPSDSITPCSPDSETYEHNVNCTFEFFAASDHHIYVEFPTFLLDADCTQDYTELHFASNTVRRLCGSVSAPTILYDVFQSNYALVTFMTNSEFRCLGFKAFFFPYPALPFGRKKRSLASTKGSELSNKRTRRDVGRTEEADMVRSQFASSLDDIRLSANQLVNADSVCTICDKESIEDCRCSPSGFFERSLFSLYKIITYAKVTHYNYATLFSTGSTGTNSQSESYGGGGSSSSSSSSNYCVCNSS